MRERELVQKGKEVDVYSERTNREEVNREPLTPPKVERATEMGMIHAMTPSSFSPNVWRSVRTEVRVCMIVRC